MVLVRGDGGEDALGEYERLELFLLEVRDGSVDGTVSSEHEVDPWLVFVHRVQHQLVKQNKLISINFSSEYLYSSVFFFK